MQKKKICAPAITVQCALSELLRSMAFLEASKQKIPELFFQSLWSIHSAVTEAQRITYFPLLEQSSVHCLFFFMKQSRCNKQRMKFLNLLLQGTFHRYLLKVQCNITTSNHKQIFFLLPQLNLDQTDLRIQPAVASYV